MGYFDWDNSMDAEMADTVEGAVAALRTEGRMWYVEFTVPRHSGDKIFSAGPYKDDDIDYQLRDIKTYEGVTDAKKVPKDE
jgi:hypothetical protein